MVILYDYDSAWNRWEDMKKYGPASRHTRRLIIKYIKNLNFKSVLDVGCGEGSLLQSLGLTGKDLEIHGEDISEKAIKLAKSKIENGTFKVMDVSKKSLDKKFDLVICSEVLEHIEDDVSAIKNLHKMSEYIIITVPIGKMGAEDLQVGHVRRYSKNEMVNKLENAGFEIIKLREWGFPFYSPLYRSIIKHTAEESRSGKFGIIRKLISTALYYIFLLNVFDKGDRIVILAKSSCRIDNDESMQKGIKMNKIEKIILDFYHNNYKKIFPRSFQPEQFVKDNLNTEKAITHLRGLQSQVDLKNKKMLEIGCGFGSFVLTARTKGLDCYAVDPDFASADVTRKRLQQNGFDPTVIVMGCGESLPFDNESFDVIVSFHVLEHVNEPAQVLEECIRALKPNGYLYIIVPNYNFFWEGHYGLIWLPLFPKRIAKIYVKMCGRSPHFLDSIRYITPNLLKSLLEKNNVEIKDLSISRWNHNMDKLDFPSHNVIPCKILYMTRKFKIDKIIKFIGQYGFYHEIELLVRKIG